MNRIAKLFFLLALFSLVHAAPPTFAAPYRVGIPLPLTGYDQIYGEEMRRGFELAKELLGDKDVELVFDNDECDPSKGVGVIKKLLDVDKVDAIGGLFCNSVLFAVAPLLNRSSIPVLTTGANPGDQKDIGKKIYRLFPADHLGVAPLTSYISKNHKRLCMLTESDAFSELVARTVRSEWKKLGPAYELFSEDVDIGQKDYRSVLLRLAQKKCEALFINTAGDDGFITAFKQATDLKFDAALFAYYMPGSSFVQKALGASLEGVVYATIPSIDEVTSELGKNFAKKFKERYGDFQVAVPIAVLAYESLRLMVEAKAAGVPLDQYLKSKEIKNGALGAYSFDSDGGIQGIKFKIVRLEDGKEVAVSE